MVAPVTVKIDGNVDPLKSALGEASKSVNVFGHQMDVSLPTSKLDLAVKSVKALAKGTKNVASAARDASAEEQIFADAMAAAGAAQGDWVEQTDSAISASMRLAFTDTETRKAITALSTATGDSAKSVELLAGAQDIARLAGVDLETAADAVAKAYNGQDAALKRMLPGLEAGATAQDTIKNATDLAAGAADNYAKSSQATGEKASIAFDEIKETIGTSLMPAMQELVESIKPLLAQFVQLLSVILPPLLNLFSKFFQIASKVAGVIGKITSAIGKLIQKIKELLGPLTEAVDKLRNLDLNPFAATAGAAISSAAQVGSRAGASAAAAKEGGQVTINIYGDPAMIEARVVRALRGYTFRNGAGSAFAPQRV